jgi:hypothetical protein
LTDACCLMLAHRDAQERELRELSKQLRRQQAAVQFAVAAVVGGGGELRYAGGGGGGGDGGEASSSSSSSSTSVSVGASESERTIAEQQRAIATLKAQLEASRREEQTARQHMVSAVHLRGGVFGLRFTYATPGLAESC